MSTIYFRRRRAACLGLVIASMFSGHALAADTTWTAGASGSWDTAANWNNGTPTLGSSAFVDNGAPAGVVVTIGASVTRNVGTLVISAGDAVSVSNNSFLQINGSGSTSLLNNAGEVQINAGGNSTRLRFTQTGDGTITGGGTITLSGANAMLDGTAAARVINVNNYIQGQGNIGAEVITFTNSGTIDANVSGATLTLDPDGGSGTQSFLANTGTMRATNGGTLTLTGANGGTFNNTGGIIEAQDNSQVRLISAARVTGGTFNTTGTGNFRVPASNTAFFTDVVNNGAMFAENNTDFGIANTFVNNGTVRIEAGGNATDIEIQNDTLVSGPGQIVLSGALAGINGTAAARLTNAAGHTIRGEGRVGQEVITITNQGLIIADVTGGTMTLDPDGNSGSLSFLANTGTMRATNGGTMTLTGTSGGTFNNTGGIIEALDNSQVRLISAARVTGGTFNTTGTGNVRVPTGNNAFLTDVVNNGAMFAENNTDFGIANTFVNNGTVRIEAGANATDIEIQNDTLVSGPGQIVLSGALAGINGTAAARLTNAAGHTIRGEGRVGQEVITITNQGLIIADVTGGTMTLDPDGNSGSLSFLANTGTMRATNGGTMTLTGASGGTFNNTGGIIEALDNSQVRLISAANVTGGTFNTTATGSVSVAASSNGFFTDVVNNGVMFGENGSDFGIASTFVNSGTVTIDSTGATTDLEIQNDTTISGTGVIILSGTTAGINGAPAARLTNGASHTIRGRGSIGQEVITVTNDGQIIADVAGTSITLDPDGNSGTLSFLQNNGTLRATNGATMVLTGNSGGTFTGNGSIIADAGSTLQAITSATGIVGPISGAGTASINASSNITAESFRISTLSISSATARVTAGGGTIGTSKVETLTLAGTGRLDLTDHDLALDYTGASPIASIRPLIATAFGSGSWTGVGITSSTAATAASTSTKTGLGYADATDLPGGMPAGFGGVSVDATTVFIRYTLLGDVNLDRSVNISDFALLASNFNTAGLWPRGDMNYDGTVNIGDFSLLASNFNKVLVADVPRGAAVPEPALAGAMSMAAMLCARRRK